MKDLNLRATRLGDRFLDGPGVRDSPGYGLTDGLHGGGFTYDSAAVGFEPVQIKQGHNFLRFSKTWNSHRPAQLAHSAWCTGIVNVNVEPTPTWLFTQIRPPWSSMNFRHRVNPSPVPSAFFSAVPT